MRALRPLLIALQFLTRLPVPLAGPPEDAEMGRSLLWFPFVGLLLGLLLFASALLLKSAGVTSLAGAAVLLTAWVLCTGGLHLDGLADCADAWVGGAGDRERTLAIMKDPHCGSMGVIALILLLLVKLSMLDALLGRQSPASVLLAPVLGRGAALALFATTPYVRPAGLGAAMASHLPRRAAWIVLAATFGAAALAPGHGLAMSAAAFLALFLWRRELRRRIGGTTGDTAGALVELVEAAALFGAVLTVS
jgi:adenosylcobinamide-GDP ribazoletransferase